MKTGSQQSGHAAILFVLFIPILFGVFTLGTDGARALQDKARMNEATEVASLAVAAQNSDSSSVQKNTAKAFISYYFPYSDIQADDLTITKITCTEDTKNSACTDTDSNVLYYQYTITGSVTQDTWFSTSTTELGMGDKYNLGGSSMSRKYESESVDVVLVADFSASMYDKWSGGNQRKFIDLKDVMIDVAEQVAKYNSKQEGDKNTIGIVGFDFYTSTMNGSTREFYGNIYCDKIITITYDKHGRSSLSWINSSDGRCYSKYPTNPDYSQLNAGKTISRIFTASDVIHSKPWYSSDVTNISKFRSIPLTSNIDSLETDIKNSSYFNITADNGSGTASFAGLIKGAQIAASGDNPRRLIIILSDGADSYVEKSNNFSDQLINGGLCTTITNTLNSQKTSAGRSVISTLAVIGFDYDINKYPQLSNCVGSDNIYKAENKSDISSKILELISEEIGRLVAQ
jgi:tight adherence protein G